MRFKKKQVDIFGKIEDNMGKETIKSGRNKWNAEIRQTIIFHIYLLHLPLPVIRRHLLAE